jgi:transposase InsO family protein
MNQHIQDYSLPALCTALQTTASGYYAWRRNQASARYQAKQQQRQQTHQRIKALFEASRGRSGRVRLARACLATSLPLSEHAVRVAMQAQGLRAKAARKFKATTHSKHTLPVAPNLLNQDFQATAPNQKWVTDITYLWTQEGWLYLSVIVDLFARRVIAWQTSAHIDRHLVCDTLKSALAMRGYPKGVIIHSDRGSQYCSQDFLDIIKQYSLAQSMSKKGDCYDNAAMESWFHSLKVEAIHGTTITTRQQARDMVFEYIETYYNHNRLHSTLNYMTPLQFEQNYANMQNP